MEHDVYIHAIEVVNTLNSGTVTQIDVLNPTEGWETVWSGEPRTITNNNIFKPQLQVTREKMTTGLDSVTVSLKLHNSSGKQYI